MPGSAKRGGSKEAEILTRSSELCDQVGADAPQRFSTLAQLRSALMVIGQVAESRNVANQALRLAREVQDPALAMEAHCQVALPCAMMGDLSESREHYEQCLALYDPEKHRSHAHIYGQDLGVTSCAGLALVLWHLGYPDQARDLVLAGRTLAEELGQPNTIALAMAFPAVPNYRRDPDALDGYREAREYAQANQLPMWIAGATMMMAWARLNRGEYTKPSQSSLGSTRATRPSEFRSTVPAS